MVVLNILLVIIAVGSVVGIVIHLSNKNHKYEENKKMRDLEDSCKKSDKPEEVCG